MMRAVIFAVALLGGGLSVGSAAAADPTPALVQADQDAERYRPMAACSAWKSSARIGIGYCAASSGIKSYRLNGACRNASGGITYVQSGTGRYGGVLSVVCPLGTKLTSVWFSHVAF